nr:hypothetical protein BaRGS_007675 [Batillaria attramentaria]
MKLENRLQELNLLDIPSKDAAGASGLDIEEDDHEETTSSKEKDPDADAESPHLEEEKEEVEKRKNGGSSDIPVGDVDENPRKGKGGISEDESPEKRQPGRILGEGFKLGKRGSEDEVRKQLENINGQSSAALCPVSA